MIFNCFSKKAGPQRWVFRHPNAKIAADVQAAELARQEGQIVGQIRQATMESLSGLDPQDVLDLARKLGYEAELSWASGDEAGRFDVIYWIPETQRPDFPSPIRSASPGQTTSIPRVPSST